MSTAPSIVFSSSHKEKLTDAIHQTIRGESTYEWIDAPLTDNDHIHLEVELERTDTEENPELILSLVILVGNSYLGGDSPPELLSEVDSQLEEIEANLEAIISESLQHSYTLSFEHSNSYNGEDTAYVTSIVSSAE